MSICTRCLKVNVDIHTCAPIHSDYSATEITIKLLKNMSFEQLRELMFDVRERNQLITILQATESVLMFLENSISISEVENEHKLADDAQRYRDYKGDKNERPY